MEINFEKMEYELKNVNMIYIPLIMLVVAELLILDGNVITAIYIHTINFLFIISIIIFINLKIDIRENLQGFMLITLLRIVNISMPKLDTVLIQYYLIYGLMFIPIYYNLKEHSAKDLGITFKNLVEYIPIGFLIGTVIATAEYTIINPVPLINKINLANLFIISIVMFAFIGVVEEILFRTILQTRLKNIIGLRYAILVSGFLFGIMHSEYGRINEILFASIIGIVIGYIFYRTRSLLLTVVIHGTTNVVLFGILPLLYR